jgi:hypothetical protein
MTNLLYCNDVWATQLWSSSRRREILGLDDLLYHILVQSSSFGAPAFPQTTTTTTGIILCTTQPQCCCCCSYGWQLELLGSLLSLLVWSLIVALLGSLAVEQIDRERIQEIEKLRKDRLGYVLKVVKIKVRFE